MRAVHQGLRGLAGAICGPVASACSGQSGLLSFLEQAEGAGLAHGGRGRVSVAGASLPWDGVLGVGALQWLWCVPVGPGPDEPPWN